MKKAFVITGPESSGSVYISKIIAHVVGKSSFGDWPGYGLCGQIGDDIVVLHRSQPFMEWNKYFTLDQFKEMFDGYQIYFICTTRDITISNISKVNRFGRNQQACAENLQKSRSIVAEILANQELSIIWSYETFIYLGPAYLEILYRFLNVRSNFYPDNIIDGNTKYLPNSVDFFREQNLKNSA